MEDLILVNHVGVPDLQMILCYKTESTGLQFGSSATLKVLS